MLVYTIGYYAAIKEKKNEVLHCSEKTYRIYDF